MVPLGCAVFGIIMGVFLGFVVTLITFGSYEEGLEPKEY